MPVTLDALDRTIMRELEADGRRAFRDIARQLNVSEATVRSRVRRLQDSGALQIIAFADPLQLGFSGLASLLLHVDAGHQESVIAALGELPEISYISTILGPADILTQVVVRDQRELAAFLRERVRSLPGVKDTVTLLETEVHKLRFTVPPSPDAETPATKPTAREDPPTAAQRSRRRSKR
jgi:Lrp/AsnC family transcriptional regulator, regulator for asnA, asnC and gidA